MQEFFMDYGLWLLVGLLVIIGLVFLLSGKGKEQNDAPATIAPEPPVSPVETHIAVAPPVTPLSPVETIVVEPLAVEPLAIEPAVAIITPTTAPGDDLLRIKGVGPKLKAMLADLGVTRFAQIAAWTDSDLAAIDPKLGNFKGRPVRDQWIDQAKYLAAGDIAGFEAKYGKM